MKLAIRVVFAIALAGFSTSALVSPAFAEDKKDDKAQKAEKTEKKKKSNKKDEEKSGW